MGKWPALDVLGGDELALAAADEFSPTAAETRGETLRLFFATPVARDAAADSLSHRYSVVPLEVDDEDWARRSQEHLSPIAIGRVLVLPSPSVPGSPVAQAFRPADAGLTPRATTLDSSLVSVVIQPSMGFGTGHHATTRLCLLALQAADLRGAFVIDVGTGSGILAIAAARLGAARVLGVDNDADAIQSAIENLALNPGTGDVSFKMADLLTIVLPPANLIVANLTGTLLARTAAALVGALSPGGLLIVSGILADEEEMVAQAFAGVAVTERRQEDEWRCLVMVRADAAGLGAK